VGRLALAAKITHVPSVVSVSALCMAHYLNDRARLGWAVRRAIEDDYDGTVAVFASGSLSHRFAQNGLAPEYAFKVWSPFLQALDQEVIRIWQAATGRPSAACCPSTPPRGMARASCTTPRCCWAPWTGPTTTAGPRSSRRTSVPRAPARFPVTPQTGAAIPRAQAAAAGYTAGSSRL